MLLYQSMGENMCAPIVLFKVVKLVNILYYFVLFSIYCQI